MPAGGPLAAIASSVGRLTRRASVASPPRSRSRRCRTSSTMPPAITAHATSPFAAPRTPSVASSESSASIAATPSTSATSGVRIGKRRRESPSVARIRTPSPIAAASQSPATDPPDTIASNASRVTGASPPVQRAATPSVSRTAAIQAVAAIHGVPAPDAERRTAGLGAGRFFSGSCMGPSSATGRPTRARTDAARVRSAQRLPRRGGGRRAPHRGSTLSAPNARAGPIPRFRTEAPR